MSSFIYSITADLVVVVHLLFVIYATGGALLALKWRWTVLMHIPAAVWAILISFYGWVCPLTPLEKWLREQAGEAAYQEGFVEHYIVPILYPGDLTPAMQAGLGIFVLIVNLTAYAWVIKRKFL